MSRIHEALKKAGSEGPAVQPLELEVHQLPVAPHTEAKGARSSPIEVLSLPPNLRVSADDVGSQLDHLSARCAHPVWHFDPNINAFVDPENRAPCAERFRTLRSRLYQLRSNRPLRKLLVTSAVSGEGKTFTASNLAQAIARQAGRSVLVIDSDLRRSRLHAMMGAPSSPGLTEFLLGEADETAIVQFGKSEQKGTLCLIPSGKKVTNPNELLSNGRLQTLVDRLASVFDWIVLDSPPYLAVSDASVLAEMCDGLLMVTKAGSTPSTLVAKALKEAHQRNVVGIVLNAVPNEGGAYGSCYNVSDEEPFSPEPVSKGAI